MKTKEEKIKILSEAIQILGEEIAIISSSPTPPQPVTQWPSPEFDKHREQVENLHNHGYTPGGISRTLNIPSSNVQNWLKKLGLTPNKQRKRGPGSINKKKTLTGKTQKHTMLSTKEQNAKLKEEQEYERQNAQLLSSPDDGTSGEESSSD